MRKRGEKEILYWMNNKKAADDTWANNSEKFNKETKRERIRRDWLILAITSSRTSDLRHSHQSTDWQNDRPFFARSSQSFLLPLIDWWLFIVVVALLHTLTIETNKGFLYRPFIKKYSIHRIMFFPNFIRMVTLTILLSSSRGVESFTSPSFLTTQRIKATQSTVTSMARLDSNEKSNTNFLSVATASAFLAWTLFSGSAWADGTSRRVVALCIGLHKL